MLERDIKLITSYLERIDEAYIVVMCIGFMCIVLLIDGIVSLYILTLVKVKTIKNMALNGIRSLKEDNELSKDICNYLIAEGFKVTTKSVKPEYTIIKGTLQFYKELGGSEQATYRAFVTTKEIAIEVRFMDNNSPADIFYISFVNEESFVSAYNEFTEKVADILR